MWLPLWGECEGEGGMGGWRDGIRAEGGLVGDGWLGGWGGWHGRVGEVAAWVAGPVKGDG